MTIGNALTFIKRGFNDSTLRERLNTSSSLLELHEILADENLLFSSRDFDQAFHLFLVKCREEEEAELLNEFKMWWILLFRIMEPITCGNQY